MQASTYAKNENEKATYLEYYRNYYANGGTLDGSSNNRENANSTDAEKSGIPTDMGDKRKDLGVVTVDGVEYKRYGKYSLKLLYSY